MNAIIEKIKELFVKDADIAAIVTELVDMIVKKIFGFINDTEGYNA